MTKENLVDLCLTKSPTKISIFDSENISTLLSKSPHVEELSIDYCKCIDNACAILVLASRQSQLRKVSFIGCEIIDNNMLDLANALATSPLICLRLEWTKIGDDEMSALAAVVGDPNIALRELKLIYCQLTKSGLDTLAKALKTSPLTALSLQSNAIKSITSLATALEHSKLETLDLENNAMNFRQCEVLARRIPKSQISELNLAKNNIGQAGAEALASILSKSKLTKLNLHTNDINSDGIHAILVALPESRLKSVDMRRSIDGIPAFGNILALDETSLAETIGSVLGRSQLEGLQLGSNLGLDFIIKDLPVSHVTGFKLDYNQSALPKVEVIGKSLQASRITRIVIRFSASNISRNEIIEFIRHMLPMQHLEELHVGYLENFGEVCEKFAQCPKLQRLHICDSREGLYGNNSGNSIVELLLQGNLTHLSLRNTNLGNDGIIKIAAILPKTHLVHLDLGGNDIGDEGALALASTIDQSKLVTILLPNNKIANAGAQALAQSVKGTKLKRVDLMKNNVYYRTTNGNGRRGVGHRATIDEQVTFSLLGYPAIRVSEFISNDQQLRIPFKSRKYGTLLVLCSALTIPRLRGKSVLKSFLIELIRRLSVMLWENTIESFNESYE